MSNKFEDNLKKKKQETQHWNAHVWLLLTNNRPRLLPETHAGPLWYVYRWIHLDWMTGIFFLAGKQRIPLQV